MIKTWKTIAARYPYKRKKPLYTLYWLNVHMRAAVDRLKGKADANPLIQISNELSEIQTELDAPIDLNSEMEAARAEMEARNKSVATWLSQNNKFDGAKLKNDWEKLRNKVKPLFLNDAIEAMALMDGVQTANEALDLGLNIEGSGIEDSIARDIIGKLFLIKFVERSLDTIKLPKSVKEAFLARVVARELPLKDNLPKAEPNNPARMQAMVQQMAEQYANANLKHMQKAARQNNKTVKRDKINVPPVGSDTGF